MTHTNDIPLHTIIAGGACVLGLLICFAVLLRWLWLMTAGAQIKQPKKYKPVKLPCERCGSRDTSRGFYTRGYNELCTQAAGDSGHWCNTCGHITFDQSYEDYVAGLQSWVKPYPDVKDSLELIKRDYFRGKLTLRQTIFRLNAYTKNDPAARTSNAQLLKLWESRKRQLERQPQTTQMS